MCNARKWTLRKQITVVFFFSTLFFLLLLATVVAVNLIVMHNQTKSSVEDTLAENTSTNMNFIAQESGLALTQLVSLYSSLNSQIDSLLEIASGSVDDLIDTAVFTTTTDPNKTYTQLQSSTRVTFQQSTTYNAQVSFNASAVYYPNPSILSQTVSTQSDFDAFIDNSGSLDKYLPSIMTSELASDILFINMYYIQDGAEVLRIYPAYPLASTYTPNISTWYNATKNFGTSSGITWKQAIGPYIDEKGTGNKIFAISLPLTNSAGTLIGAIAIEFLTSAIDNLVNSITFLNTGEALLFNSNFQIFSAPTSWNLSSSTILTISSSSISSLVGNISSFLPASSSTTTSTISDDSRSTIAIAVRATSASNSTTQSYYVAEAFFDSTQVVDSGWLYGLLLYTNVDDADQVDAELTDLMNTDLITIGIITLVAIIVTLSIVGYVTFRISTKISRPLVKLMEFSDLVHKNAANKTLCNKYFQSYENDEGIIGELIQVYKKVIGISAEPIKARYSKTQTLRKEEVEYPLNQFHVEFISKTQGESPINWRGLIDQIPDDKKTN